MQIPLLFLMQAVLSTPISLTKVVARTPVAYTIPTICETLLTSSCLQTLYSFLTIPATQVQNIAVSGFKVQYAIKVDLQVRFICLMI